MPYNTFDPDVNASLAGTSNNTLDGLNVAEGCPATNMNAGLRGLMANLRQLWNAVTSPTATNPGQPLAHIMPKAGGEFAGAIKRASAGAFSYWDEPSLQGGKKTPGVFNSATPANPAEGDEFIEYS